MSTDMYRILIDKFQNIKRRCEKDTHWTVRIGKNFEIVEKSVQIQRDVVMK